MVLMPFDAIKDKRRVNQGYEKLASPKKKTPPPRPPPPQQGKGWRRDFKL